MGLKTKFKVNGIYTGTTHVTEELYSKFHKHLSNSSKDNV